MRRKWVLVSIVTVSLLSGTSSDAEAGIIPWMWNVLFGPPCGAPGGGYGGAYRPVYPAYGYAPAQSYGYAPTACQTTAYAPPVMSYSMPMNDCCPTSAVSYGGFAAAGCSTGCPTGCPTGCDTGCGVAVPAATESTPLSDYEKPVAPVADPMSSDSAPDDSVTTEPPRPPADEFDDRLDAPRPSRDDSFDRNGAAGAAGDAFDATDDFRDPIKRDSTDDGSDSFDLNESRKPVSDGATGDGLGADKKAPDGPAASRSRDLVWTVPLSSAPERAGRAPRRIFTRSVRNSQSRRSLRWISVPQDGLTALR